MSRNFLRADIRKKSVIQGNSKNHIDGKTTANNNSQKANDSMHGTNIHSPMNLLPLRLTVLWNIWSRKTTTEKMQTIIYEPSIIRSKKQWNIKVDSKKIITKAPKSLSHSIPLSSDTHVYKTQWKKHSLMYRN